MRHRERTSARRCGRLRSQGFTLVELVTVIILIGILAVVAIPRLESSAFRERGYRDAVLTTLAHARRVAVASRRFVCVAYSASTVSVTRDASNMSPESSATIQCTQSVSLPSRMPDCAADNQVCAPTGVSLGNSGTVIFDPLGRSIDSAGSPTAHTIQISNQSSISVAAETGYVQ